MALFEGYERKIDKINAVLAAYGINGIEEAKAICDAKGIDPYKMCEETQPICFENAKWAYVVGAAIAIKKGCVAAESNQGLLHCRHILYQLSDQGRIWYCGDPQGFHMPGNTA